MNYFRHASQLNFFMNRILSGSALFIAIALCSCGGNNSADVDKSIMPSDSAKAASTITQNAATTSPSMVQSVPSQEVINSAKTISADQAAKLMPQAGLNPAHGQPGHRCDIPVGAPLNSPPAAASKPQQPVISTGTPPAASTGMVNPAHGQPGHDCSVPVGAPLKNG